MITLLYAHIWPENGCYTSPQAVFILKYVWTIFTLTPHILFISLHYSKYALWLDCNQTMSRPPATKQPDHFHNYFLKPWRAMWAQSDFWESRPSLNTSWHHWLIKFHGWLRPMGNWNQQGQLQDRKDVSQRPKDRNDKWEKGSFVIRAWERLY